MAIQNRLVSYGLATLLVAGATIVSLLAFDILEPSPSLAFVLAVLGAARLGGLNVGRFATMLSSPVMDYFLIPPIHHLSTSLHEAVPTIIFIAVGVIISRLTSRWFESQQQLKMANSGLEQRVAERTAQLNDANADLGRFAYTVSHDIRQPLRTMHMFAQLLLTESAHKLDESETEYLHLISDSAVSLAHLVQDVLDYARAGEAELSKVPCDVTAIVRQVIRECQVLISDAQAQITWGWLPHVEGDTVQVRQIFQNLIVNAVKYHKPGVAPLVEISAERRGQLWEFAIKDNGVGIALEHQGKIFKPFIRLSAEASGSGIGLATCQRIAERHGGAIRLESMAGEGSTFFFTLPAMPCSRGQKNLECVRTPEGCNQCDSRRDYLRSLREPTEQIGPTG